MARITPKGISGAIGPVVFYIMDNKEYARAAPRRTKKRGAKRTLEATIFGIVSKCASPMVSELKKYLAVPFKRGTYNTLRGWMRNQYALHLNDVEWPLSVKESGMCQVNPATDLRDRFKVDIIATDMGAGQIKVTIDALNPLRHLGAPARATAVTIKVVAITALFSSRTPFVQAAGDNYKVTIADELLPAKEILLETASETGAVAIVVVALEYENGKQVLPEVELLPAAVVAMGKLK